MPQSENQNNARNRFVLWFFGAGTLAPLILVTIGFLVGPRLGGGPSGLLGTALWLLTWVVWPTWILFMDAEHAVQIIVVLLFASPLNGLWYGVVGLLVWHLRHWKKRPPGLSDKWNNP